MDEFLNNFLGLLSKSGSLNPLGMERVLSTRLLTVSKYRLRSGTPSNEDFDKVFELMSSELMAQHPESSPVS
jgi:hypothetical protein